MGFRLTKNFFFLFRSSFLTLFAVSSFLYALFFGIFIYSLSHFFLLFAARLSRVFYIVKKRIKLWVGWLPLLFSVSHSFITKAWTLHEVSQITVDKRKDDVRSHHCMHTRWQLNRAQSQSVCRTFLLLLLLFRQSQYLCIMIDEKQWSWAMYLQVTHSVICVSLYLLIEEVLLEAMFYFL